MIAASRSIASSVIGSPRLSSAWRARTRATASRCSMRTIMPGKGPRAVAGRQPVVFNDAASALRSSIYRESRGGGAGCPPQRFLRRSRMSSRSIRKKGHTAIEVASRGGSTRSRATQKRVEEPLHEAQPCERSADLHCGRLCDRNHFRPDRCVGVRRLDVYLND